MRRRRDGAKQEGRAVGEVRTRVTLTNAADEVLVRRGLLPPDQVRSYDADAMVDTGAVRCVLPQHVADRLGLALVGHRVAEYADGRLESVPITEPFTLRIQDREEQETALVLGDEVLIGQTALEKMDLLPDCAKRRLIPNPAHPDQPVTKVKRATGE
ncbi:MAG: retroviral-like aspartic protease family protein [Armatimonadetes bacterium]|nr:retroviral-like aspartic protease family protein [Armatimonadota bacterium]